MQNSFNPNQSREVFSGMFSSYPLLVDIAHEAFDRAEEFHYDCVCLEHMLVDLAKHDCFSQHLMRAGGDPKIFIESLNSTMRDHFMACPDRPERVEVHQDLIDLARALEDIELLYPAMSTDEMLVEAAALFLTKVDGSAAVETALIECGAGIIVQSFAGDDQEGDNADIAAEIVRRVDERSSESEGNGAEAADTADGGRTKPRKLKNMKGEEVDPFEMLKPFIRNLTEAAEKSALDPVLGREAEIEKVLSCLKRRRKSSVLLFGEAGIGKTAIAEGVAQKIQAGGNGDLDGRPVWEVSLSGMVAGTRFRGEFEERALALMACANHSRAILFIDEIHLLVGAGTSADRGMDAANIFKPALARGELSIIGATTSHEMRALVADSALMRRFETLMVAEPSKEKTREILARASEPYVAHHKLGITQSALDLVCDITDQYQPEKRFPDKAFDLLDASFVVARNMMTDALFPESGHRVLPRHVLMAADDMGIRRPRRPDPSRMKRMTCVEAELRATTPDQPVIEDIHSRALQALFDMGSKGLRMGITLMGPQECVADLMVRSFAKCLDLPVFVIDGDQLSGSNASDLLFGSAQQRDMPGLLTMAAYQHPELVLQIRNVDMIDHSALAGITELCRSGLFRTADGRQMNLRNAWTFFTLEGEQEGPRFGFGVAQSSEVSELPKQLRNVLPAPLRLMAPGREALVKRVSSELEELRQKLQALGMKLRISEGTRDALIERRLREGAGSAKDDKLLSRVVRKLAENPRAEEITLEEGDLA